MSTIDLVNKQIISIDSRMRISGTSSRFSYDLGIKSNNSFTHICLLQASIPKTFYAVSAPDRPGTFTLTELGVSYTCTIPNGNWDRDSFSTGVGSIATILNAASAAMGHNWSYTCTYPEFAGADLGVFTYAVSGNSGQPSFTFSTGSVAAILMGFQLGGGTGGSSTYTFSAGSLVGNAVANVQTVAAIQVHVSIAASQGGTTINSGTAVDTNDVAIAAPRGDILQTVMANTGSPFFSNILYTQPDVDSNSRELTTNTSSVVDIYITDSNGAYIDTNGMPVILDILLYKKNYFWEMARGLIRTLSYMFASGSGIPTTVLNTDEIAQDIAQELTRELASVPVNPGPPFVDNPALNSTVLPN